MTGSGVYQMLDRRAEEAGYDPQAVHPHMFRHTVANDWLAGGGSEGDLMRLMGWHDRSMVDRYAADMQDQRAFGRQAAARRHVLTCFQVPPRPVMLGCLGAVLGVGQQAERALEQFRRDEPGGYARPEGRAGGVVCPFTARRNSAGSSGLLRDVIGLPQGRDACPPVVGEPASNRIGCSSPGGTSALGICLTGDGLADRGTPPAGGPRRGRGGPAAQSIEELSEDLSSSPAVQPSNPQLN